MLLVINKLQRGNVSEIKLLRIQFVRYFQANFRQILAVANLFQFCTVIIQIDGLIEAKYLGTHAINIIN